MRDPAIEAGYAAEAAGNLPVPSEPAAEVSSLTPAALQEGFDIEATMYLENGQPNPAYWHNPAAQQRYRQLIAGELAGLDDAAPVTGSDTDMPMDAGRYDVQGLPIYTAEDRDIFDIFAPVAFEAGVGQAKMRAMTLWVFTSEPTLSGFVTKARGDGWTEPQIKALADAYQRESARRAAGLV